MHARLFPIALTLSLSLVALVAPHLAHAQAPAVPDPAVQATPDPRAELTDAWMQDILAKQDQADDGLRYFAAPVALVLGGLFLSMPAWSELTPATDIALVASGAMFLTSAAGTWATPDPYDAYQWYGITSSLAFAGLGVSQIVLCTDEASDCSDHAFLRHMVTSLGIIETGMFMTSLALWAVSPPPSPKLLSLSIHGLPAEQRHARVHAFLREREHVRRLHALLSAPWSAAMGITFLTFAHEASSSGMRAFTYVAGSALLLLTTGSTLYELLSTKDSERFMAGEHPERR